MTDQRTVPAAKRALREQMLTARQHRSGDERNTAALLICDRVLALAEVAAASTVAAYSTLPGEPGTGPLISALHARDVAVLLPVRQADSGLHWVLHEPGHERLDRPGIAEPLAADPDRRLLNTATVAICPGLAGDRWGNRLGRGGGSYDRALAAVEAEVLRCLLLYDDEVVDAVPGEPHDRPVDVIVTPTRTLRVAR